MTSRSGGTGSAAGALPPLFTAAVLLSAALLFLVQPMFARMVLPVMGGTPATWTTCLLFFQIVLLCGYLYVHVTSTRLPPRAQAALHVAFLAAVVIAFPLAAPPAIPDDDAPVAWLLRTLTASVGLPFLAVSGTAPLLQRWYARASGRDPYFLYAASNLGSLAGLLGYPFVIEPTLTLAGQRAAWSGGFALLAALIAGCAAASWGAFAGAAPGATNVAAVSAASPPPRAVDRLRWVGLALVPSSLLLGVTTHISTDVAAVPLLWVVPLSIYLLTFTAAFASRPPISQRWTARLVPAALAAAVIALVLRGNWWVGLAVHLSTFAVVAMAFHRELADRRPGPADLTQFFLLVSIGGAFGGIFNAVVAPRLFTDVAEYPLMLGVAALLRPAPHWRDGRLEPWPLVLGLPATVFVVLAVLWMLGFAGDVDPGSTATGFWLLAAVVLAATNRRGAFAVALSAAIAATLAAPRTDGQLVFAARSFFGVHRVTRSADGTRHRLLHGTTLHGWQRLDSMDRCAPTSYYHPEGPAGQLFLRHDIAARDVAVIGLGAGGLVCYQPPGGRWTFLEIDPLVERIARDPSLFTFLAHAAGDVRVVIGDGRRTLAAIAPGSLDALVLDAFSSDAVPVHLLTREFVAAALATLRPDGRLVVHISNRYLDLAPVVAAAAAAAGAAAVEQFFEPGHPEAVASRWMVVGAPAVVAPLRADGRWREVAPGPRPWTDDFSNLLDVIVWGGPATLARR